MRQFRIIPQQGLRRLRGILVYEGKHVVTVEKGTFSTDYLAREGCSVIIFLFQREVGVI